MKILQLYKKFIKKNIIKRKFLLDNDNELKFFKDEYNYS